MKEINKSSKVSRRDRFDIEAKVVVTAGEVEFVNGDQALAERIRCGDRAAENELVQRYASRVLAMMTARLRDREIARELADDVLMSTVTALRRGTVKDTSRLGAFMHGTALNLANNYRRSQGRRPRTEPLDDDVVGLESTIFEVRDEEVRAVQECVARLPAQDQRILLMTLVEGLKPGEIAARLGMSDDVVRQRKSRAMRVVREMLAAESRSSCPRPLGGK